MRCMLQWRAKISRIILYPQQTTTTDPQTGAESREHTVHDVAIVELDAGVERKAFPQAFLKLASMMPQTGSGVHAIGHPEGLPMKYIYAPPQSISRPCIQKLLSQGNRNEIL